MWEQIIAGVVTGIGYSLAGFKATKKEDDETVFEWLLLGKSVVICGIVGGIAGWMNTDFNVVLTGAIGVGISKTIDLAIKFIK